ALPKAPDFLQVGDFNSDGYVDVLAAARGGGALYLLAGDGPGTLRAPQQFELPGQLTALQADDFKQPGKFTSLALGVRTPEGPKALIYNDGLSVEPKAYEMPADVTALAFGQLDDDGITDVAAASMNQVTVIHSASVEIHAAIYCSRHKRLPQRSSVRRAPESLSKTRAAGGVSFIPSLLTEGPICNHRLDQVISSIRLPL
ncbi:MAG TPA: VCBS repeat-containing protein, partial [Blastocatellia bacterium]|nr:VCBS repeat-containing protein [Blastocatellia bacterium]